MGIEISASHTQEEMNKILKAYFEASYGRYVYIVRSRYQHKCNLSHEIMGGGSFFLVI